MAASCSSKVSIKNPDGSRKDIDLDDLLGDQEFTEFARETETKEIAGVTYSLAKTSSFKLENGSVWKFIFDNSLGGN